MIRIRVGSDDLAATRFALAPLSELEFLFRRIDASGGRRTAGGPAPTIRWLDRYQPLASTRQARLLLALRPPGWGPDIVAPPPLGMGESIGSALDTVRRTPGPVAREEIERCLAQVGPVDEDVLAILRGPAAVAAIADALELLWHALIAPDWPVIRAIAERDVAHRGNTLAEHGWAAALAGLHDSLSWERDQILIRRRHDRDLDLAGRGLLLVPAVSCTRCWRWSTTRPGSRR